MINKTTKKRAYSSLMMAVRKAQKGIVGLAVALMLGSLLAFSLFTTEPAHAAGWESWFLIRPEIKMQPGATVTAQWHGNHLDLFATGTDGAVWSTWWEPNKNWQPWFLIRPEIKMRPGAAVTAQWHGNHLDLFATGTDGAVWSTWWEPNKNWQPWFLIHPEVKMQPGATVTAQWNGNHLDLFATGTDGAVWSTWWEPNKNWQPWFLIHPEIKMQPGATVTAQWNGNHLDLFATGTDGAVWSTWWEPNKNWQPWFLIHPEVKMQPGAAVTAQWLNENLFLFSTMADGTVMSSHWNPRDGWKTWGAVTAPGSVSFKAAKGAPVTVVRIDNHLDLFITGTDGAVWSTFADPYSNPYWQPWFLIRPEIKMQPGAAVTAQWSNRDHLDLFATGTDGAVWSTWWARPVPPTPTRAPQPPAPQPPSISVTRETSGGFTISGSGFTANSTVHIRVVDDFFHELWYNQTSLNDGTMRLALPNICTGSGAIHFSANDGRPNRADLTGTLWSNTFTTTCP